jgi:DNA-binding XRE family transcriptional regulator
MKIHPQVISQNGQPAFVVLPYQEYKELLDQFDELTDIEAIELSKNDNAERFPLSLVEKIAAGASAIKSFREYRNTSQTALAKSVSVSKQYISQLEAGERNGTAQVLKKIAQQLSVELNDLI